MFEKLVGVLFVIVFTAFIVSMYRWPGNQCLSGDGRGGRCQTITKNFWGYCDRCDSERGDCI